MKAWIKGIFAVLVGLLFGMAAFSVLVSTQSTPGFVPNSGQLYLLETGGAAIVAFLAAQLGITVATAGDSLRTRANIAMGSQTGNGHLLLLLDTLIFLIAGLWFVLLWLQPDLVAVAENSPPLKEAPEFIQTQAKTFVGVTLAALAALGPSAAS